MKTFFIKQTGKILKNKNILEKKLKLKIETKDKNLIVKGKELDEYVASQVIEAMEIGFPINTALLLSDENFMLEIIEIKNLTKRRNLSEIRARIIGKQGKTKQLIEELSDCFIVIHENKIGIIGAVDEIKNCINALTRIIQGSKQSSVYAYLERQRKIMHPEDLGLKIKMKKE